MVETLQQLLVVIAVVTGSYMVSVAPESPQPAVTPAVEVADAGVGSDDVLRTDAVARSGFAQPPTAALEPAPTAVPPTTLPSTTLPPTTPVPLPTATERGLSAVASMPIQPGQVGFTIAFHDARDGFGGLMYPDRRHIDIFVAPDWSDGHLRHVIAHEIGHAVDMMRNSGADQRAWRSARGFSPDVGWWAAPYENDFATPAGDFAECFAAWATGSGHSRSVQGGCAGTEALVASLAAG